MTHLRIKRIISPIFLGCLVLACSTDKDELIADIENSAPVINSTTFQIAEHSISGTVIGTVEATDANEDELTYTIDSDFDINIDESTGELSVGENLILDFETGEDVPFTVSVFDGTMIVDLESSLTITNVDEYDILNDAQQELVDYFSFLTLWKGPNNSPLDSTIKWGTSIQLYLDGAISDDYRASVTTALADMNTLFTDSDFTITITENETMANAILYFGAKSELESLWPDIFEIVNGGNFDGYASSSFSNRVISEARIWVSSASEVLFKHELGHSIGLGHSNLCESENSFMCSSVDPSHDILSIEEQVLRYLYHSELEAGLTEAQIQAQLSNLILLEEQ
ncbi:hypothetical protein [Maribacter sp. 2210JD10-5]|uniref:hypothetical protein n=1 Tax=Maribacter sp. 2210JD10-5 TaxID=3386272 RepID=UPI0039BD85CE